MKKPISALLALLSTLLALPAWAGAVPLTLNVYVHADIQDRDPARLYKDYLAPWKQEMEEFSGRSVEVRFITDAPAVEDIAYKGSGEQAHLNRLIDTFRSRVDEYQRHRNITPKNFKTEKHLLLVQSRLAATILGVAHQGSSLGIASLETYSAAGHELGHMLNGTHENAETLLNPWFCETYLVATRQALRSNCYRYSDANREAIKQYLRTAP